VYQTLQTKVICIFNKRKQSAIQKDTSYTLIYQNQTDQQQKVVMLKDINSYIEDILLQMHIKKNLIPLHNFLFPSSFHISYSNKLTRRKSFLNSSK